MKKVAKDFILNRISFTILLLSIQTYGQGIMMGPTVGLNVSTITIQDDIYDPSASVNNIVGLRAGLQMEFNAGRFFSLLTEASYSRQGIVIIEEGETFKDIGKIYLPYLTATIAPKLSFGNAPLKAFLTGGVYTSFILGIHQRFEGFNKITQEEDVYEYDYTYREMKDEGINRFDFGLMAAFGAEKSFRLGKVSLLIGHRVGLTNFFNKKYREEEEKYGDFVGLVKNKVFTVQASYLFPLYKPTR